MKIVASEHHPADGHQYEYEQNRSVLRYRLLHAISTLRSTLHTPRQFIETHQRAVIGSPDDKSPVGTVPQATHHKHHHRVPIHFGLRATTSTQRNVDVVAKPIHQRHVPPAPKITHIRSKIRSAEVLGDAESHHAPDANRHFRIAAEIGVDLERIKYRREDNRHTTVMVIIVENRVGVRRNLVGNAHFQEHSPQHALAAIQHHRVAPRSRRFQLGQEVIRLVNRSRHNRRKECYIGCKINKIPLGMDVVLVNLDHIGNQLKREEADANGNNQFKSAPIRFQPEQGKQFRELLDEKVQVFEVEQQADTCHNT